MADKLKQTEVTEQGFGSPVPVGVVSERAGSARPSSSACSASSTGNQVGVQDKVTGTKEVPDPFKRRESIARSPPNRSRSFSVPDLEGSIGEIRMGTQASKRRRDSEDDSDTRVKDLRRMLKKATETAVRLKELIKAIPNTKSDIKKSILELNQTMEVINRKDLEWELEVGDKRIALQAPNTQEQTSRETVEKKTMVSIGVQADVGDAENETAEMEERARQEVRETITKSRSFHEFSGILDRDWPEPAYTVVKLETGGIRKAGADCDIAAIIDPRDREEKGLLRQIAERHPEVMTLINSEATERRVEFIKKTTITTSSKKQDEEKCQFIYILPYDIDKTGVNDLQGVYSLLEECKDRMKDSGRKNIAFTTADGLDRTYLRKILEFVFKDTGVQVKLLIPGTTGSVNKAKTYTQQTVLVRKGEKSYAELLKSVKQSVDPEKIGVKIKSMKETARGDLVLSVMGGEEKASSLRTEIQAKLRDVDVATRKSTVTLHISDVDPTVNKEEIRNCIAAHIKADKNSVEITSLRPNRNGNHTVTVKLPRDGARQLISSGRIQIGWLLSKVRERVSITRCFKCLGFGHTQRECTGKDRSGECLRCGKTGHKAKDCKNTPFCTKCQAEEHRADSIRCPYYKRLVQDASKSRGRRK